MPCSLPNMASRKLFSILKIKETYQKLCFSFKAYTSSYTTLPSFQYSFILIFQLFIPFSIVSGLYLLLSSPSMIPGYLIFFLKPSLSTISPTHFSNILIHCISLEHSDSTPETNNSHIPLTDCSFQSFTCKVIETCKAFNLFCPPVTLTHKPVPGFISSLLVAHSMGRHHGHSLASTFNSLTYVSSPQPYITIPN